MPIDEAGAGQAPARQFSPKLKISALIDAKTSYAHQQNGIPFIRDFRVTNESGDPVENIELVLSFDPSFAEQKRVILQRLAPAETFVTEVVDIRSSGTYLSNVRESTAGSVIIEAS